MQVEAVGLQLADAVAVYADFVHDCAACFGYFDLVCLSGYLVDSVADFAVPVCWLKLYPADWDVAENCFVQAAADGSAAFVPGRAAADVVENLLVPAGEADGFVAFAPVLAAADAAEILPAAELGDWAAFVPGLAAADAADILPVPDRAAADAVDILPATDQAAADGSVAFVPDRAAADAVDILPAAEQGGWAAFVPDLAAADAADTLPVAASDGSVAFVLDRTAAAAAVVRLAFAEAIGSAALVLDWNIVGAPDVRAAPAAAAACVFLYSAVDLQKQNLILVIVVLIVPHGVCSHYHFWTLLLLFYEQKYDLKQLYLCRQHCSYDFWLQRCCESIYQ